MEKMKTGRPMINKTPRNKTLSIRVTAEELTHIQHICIENDIRYIDVVMEGLKIWSDKK